MNLLNSGSIKVTEWSEPPYTPKTVAGTYSLNEITSTVVPRVVAASSENLTLNGQSVVRSITEKTFYDQQLSLSYSGSLPVPILWVSSDSSIGSVNSSGFVTHYRTGSIVVRAYVGSISVSILLTLTCVGGTISDVVIPPQNNTQVFSFISISKTESSRTVAGYSDIVQISGQYYSRAVNSSTHFDQQLSVTYNISPPSSITWTSSNTSVATINSDGFLTHLDQGITTVRATCGSTYISLELNLTVTGGDTTLTPIPPPFSIITLSNHIVQRSVGGSISTLTVNDKIITRTVGAANYSDHQMDLTYVGVLPSAIVWTSSNLAVATVDSGGFVTHLSTGSTNITATVGSDSRSQLISLVVTGGTTSDVLLNYVSGSLSKAVSDEVDMRIGGKSVGSAIEIFSTQNHSTSTYVRNTQCWIYDLRSQISSESPWNSTGGNLMAGTVISPLHIIFAAHYQIGTGSTVRFVDGDGNVFNRTMVSKITPTQTATLYPDYTIGALDSPLPNSIVPAKILPANFTNYLPSLASGSTIPALCLDQQEHAIVTDLYSLDSMAQFTYPNSVNYAKRAEFYEAKISGDSGNPAYLIINGQLVLLCVWTFGGAGAGTFLTPHKTAINAFMGQLGGSYQISEVDLSGFTSYV
jgi:hypothetical protein